LPVTTSVYFVRCLHFVEPNTPPTNSVYFACIILVAVRLGCIEHWPLTPSYLTGQGQATQTAGVKVKNVLCFTTSLSCIFISWCLSTWTALQYGKYASVHKKS